MLNSSLKKASLEDFTDGACYDDKVTVVCICPKCGQTHSMRFHWIGRGTPRKFCQQCKS